MAQVHVMDHPLIVHKLSLMRDKYTGSKEFREAVEEISSLLCYEATRDLPLKEVEIETPIAHAKVRYISGKKLVVVCILPNDIESRDVIVVDPMLATGGTANAAIQFLKNYGVKNIKLLSILAVPESISVIQEQHPDVDIYCAAIDEKLNDKGYIVPGVGDAGDRLFGTK